MQPWKGISGRDIINAMVTTTWISTSYPLIKPNIQATGRNKNNSKEAEDLVIVQYEFSNKVKDIPPSKKVEPTQV